MARRHAVYGVAVAVELSNLCPERALRAGRGPIFGENVLFLSCVESIISPPLVDLLRLSLFIWMLVFL